MVWSKGSSAPDSRKGNELRGSYSHWNQRMSLDRMVVVDCECLRYRINWVGWRTGYKRKERRFYSDNWASCQLFTEPLVISLTLAVPSCASQVLGGPRPEESGQGQGSFKIHLCSSHKSALLSSWQLRGVLGDSKAAIGSLC